jgi:hypothetical protein
MGVQVELHTYLLQTSGANTIFYQNYTCGSTGTFASAGAVAKLFDISCAVNTPLFATIQDMAFSVASTTQGQALITKLGEHRPPDLTFREQLLMF